jgi:hypothetical protein
MISAQLHNILFLGFHGISMDSCVTILEGSITCFSGIQGGLQNVSGILGGRQSCFLQDPRNPPGLQLRKLYQTLLGP